MALNKLTPAAFNKQADFGTVTTKVNLNTGTNNQKVFKPELILWCAPYTRSLNQSYLLAPELQNTIVIVVRHNSKINDALKVNYQGTLYSIADLSIDDSNTYIAYDYVTLRKIVKG